MITRFESTLVSPIPGVSSTQWARFVSALDVQPPRTISPYGGLGSFDFRYRRLSEIGVARMVPSKGKKVYEFVPPWNLQEFLMSSMKQHEVLCHSVRSYILSINNGEIKVPIDISRAGVLAILHRGGVGALERWPDIFPHTRARFEAAQGSF